MKILFISYYFKPSTLVGAKRVSYWVENINKIDSSIKYDVITATKQEKDSNNIIYIENNCKSFLSYFIKDEGVTWQGCLIKYFQNIDINQYDVVLISGGPFMHFGISEYIKNNSSAKVILDFRDPFYNNPRFNTSALKDSIKKYYQDKFLKYADLVITVNKYCADLIDFENIKLIDNGFDENEFENINDNIKLKEKVINLVSIGRIDDDINIDYFFKTLEKEKKYNFNYIGNKIFADIYKNLFSHFGKKTYADTLSYVKKSDICILFTGGEAFESTTKIFDYLAMNKKILIVTCKDIHSGALHDITKNYPNIEWVNNTQQDIEKGLEKLDKKPHVDFDVSIYSRQNGLVKFLQECKNISTRKDKVKS